MMGIAMQRAWMSRILLIIAAAFLFYLSFPNCFYLPGFGALAWGFAVPLMAALQGCSLKDRLRIGSLFGMVAYALLLNWLAPLSFAGFLLLAGVFALQPIGFGLLYEPFSPVPFGRRQDDRRFSLRQLWPLQTILYPACLWVATEYIRSLLLGGFSWTLGYSQGFFPVNLQWTQWGGSYAVSFVLMAVNVCLYRVVSGLPGRRVFAGAAVVTVMLTTLYGFVQLFSPAALAPCPEKPVRIVSIQPSIDPYTKWRKELLDEVIDQHIYFTREGVTDSRADLVIWPETAIPDDFLKDWERRERITRMSLQLNVPLLVGAALQEDGRYFNAAVLLNKRGVVLDLYRKRHLIPFSEYFPFPRPQVGWAARFFRFSREFFAPGQSPGVFSLPAAGSPQRKFGVAICSENLYPGLWRIFEEREGVFAAVLINDAWFSARAALLLHAQAAAMRAVENRLSIVQATNSGFTFAVDPFGRIAGFPENLARLQSPGVHRLTVCPQRATTFYEQFGDIFAVLCVAFVIMKWTIFLVRRKLFPIG